MLADCYSITSNDWVVSGTTTIGSESCEGRPDVSAACWQGRE